MPNRIRKLQSIRKIPYAVHCAKAPKFERSVYIQYIARDDGTPFLTECIGCGAVDASIACRNCRAAAVLSFSEKL